MKGTAAIIAIACFSITSAAAQNDWPGYGNDRGAQRHSPLRQINVGNVSTLVPGWSYSMEKKGLPFRPSQSIPLVVGKVLYLPYPFNHVSALNSETGALLWEFTAKGAPSGKLGSMRSLDYWPGDPHSAARILFGTEGGELLALDAKTGTPAKDFGNGGAVNLRTPEVMNGFERMHLGISSAPFVYKDLVITGSHLVDETGAQGPAGDVRAWDVRTGKLVWTFHSVPRPGEVGHASWTGDQWKARTGVNVWSFFTADTTRGILYMPFGSPNNDYYGTDRHGANLFGNSLVAVEAATGKLKWYFQAIHHDLWDYDMPVPPILFDVIREGIRIPAVGAMTKMGMLFILNRVDGKPIYGVEERPVPRAELDGEYYSPTQPFPIKPQPLARLSFTMADIAKLTPEHEASCRELMASFGGGRNRGPFTPASAEGALVLPTTGGGAGWTGGTVDPSLGYYIINTTDSAGFRVIHKQTEEHDPRTPKESPRLYDRESGGSRNATVDGWPCWQPPWGRLSAININTGEIAWQIPFGTVRRPPPGPKTGGPNSGGGPMSTEGGITFIGATLDRLFHAFSSQTGQELWTGQLEEMALSSPISWATASGTQYVGVAAGSKFVTFKLPAKKEK